MSDIRSNEQVRLTDIDKSAVLLISIGEDAAAEVMKNLSPPEIKLLSVAMARISSVPKAVLTAVLQEFVDTMLQPTLVGIGGEAYVGGVLDKALGAEQAKRFIGQMTQGESLSGIEALQSLDPRVLGEMLKSEHPQVVAAIFAHLEPERCSAAIQYLPPELVEQVIPRLATLDSVSPAAIRDLSQMIEDLVAGGDERDRAPIGGVSLAAKILNRMDQPRTADILRKIGDADADLAQQLENSMFVFEDLLHVDDRNFQILLRSVDQKLLVAALKSTDPKLKEKVLRNLSQRAADVLRDEIAARGPMLVAEVNAAKQEIMAVAQKLEREGTIILRTDPSAMVS